jgi:hypothetical protein
MVIDFNSRECIIMALHHILDLSPRRRSQASQIEMAQSAREVAEICLTLYE